MIRINDGKDGRIVRSADENGCVHVECPLPGGHSAIESVHISRLRWDTPEDEAGVFGIVPTAHGATHARGPWWMKKAMLGGYRIYSRLRHIASVRGNGSEKECRATARLVTFAPELLATLHEMEAALRRHADVYEEHRALMQRAQRLVFLVKRDD